MKDITKTYYVGDQTINVLKGVSLEIQQGEFVAIMWPSGSGKSTMMNIIGLLDNPSSGGYILDGMNVEQYTGDEQAKIRGKKIGFVFQSYNLVPRLNLLDQVSLPLLYQWISKKERRERAKKALEQVGLGERINNRPNQLSGWQQQRVSIARAIAVNPAIILADEPTGALDSKTSAEVMDIFHELHKQGKTIIMITHEHDIASHADRTIHLRDGNIITAEQEKSGT